MTSATGLKRVFPQVLNDLYFAGARAGQSLFGEHSQRNTIKLIYKDSLMGVHPTTNGKCVKC